MTTRIKTFTRKRIYRSPYSHVQDSENYDNVQTDDKWVYRGFSNGITILNLLMTTLTLTIVYLHRSPLAPLMNTDIQCKCPQQSIDLRYKNPSMNPDIKRVSGYSPLLDEVDLTPQPRVLNGAFHDNTTIYMQDPSPEVDKAWKMFSEDVFLTPWSTVRDSGRSLSKSIHFPPGADGTPGKYVATWDIFHQIHCLNWLRQASNWEYYYGTEKPTPNFILHQKHCIHMLLQTLMCHADVDMITFEWMEGHDERVDHGGTHGMSDKVTGPHARNVKQDALPTANFNVHKMCRNFTALVEWAKKNKEKDPDETRRRLKVPENAHLNKFDDI